MKTFWKAFTLRGLLCASSGPIVLAAIYGILGATGTVEHLSPKEVCTGILTISLLAFTAAGMTAVYQLEQLPLFTAILLHGTVLYIAYILTYLFNGWLKQQLIPIAVFTVIFLAGYALIWLIIHSITKVKTESLNRMLKVKQHSELE